MINYKVKFENKREILISDSMIKFYEKIKGVKIEKIDLEEIKKNKEKAISERNKIENAEVNKKLLKAKKELAKKEKELAKKEEKENKKID